MKSSKKSSPRTSCRPRPSTPARATASPLRKAKCSKRKRSARCRTVLEAGCPRRSPRWRCRRAEANEHRAEGERNRAEDALASLKKTAPTFAAQARGLIEQGNLEDALEKIGYAVSLDKRNADYLLQQANLLQAMKKLAEAA